MPQPDWVSNRHFFSGFRTDLLIEQKIRESFWKLIGELHRQVRVLFEQFRPTIVITWGPEGGYGHSDHRVVSSVVSAEFQKRAGPWPYKLLFPAFSTHRLQNVSMELRGPVVQWVGDNWHTIDEGFSTSGFRIQTKISKLPGRHFLVMPHNSARTPRSSLPP